MFSILTFLFLFITPSIFATAFGFSQAIGLLIAIIILVTYITLKHPITLNLRYLSAKNFFIFEFIIGFLLLNIILTFLINHIYNYPKMIYSLLYIIFYIYISLTVAKYFLYINDINFKKLYKNVMLFLFFMSIAGIFNIGFFSNTSYKPVGFFSEPSHFALAVAPFILYATIKKEAFYKFYLTYYFLWGVYIQNTSILIIVLMSGLSLIQLNISNLILFILLGFGLYEMSSIPYFAERLAVNNTQTENLSTLVWLQGWANAYEGFAPTHYLGVGFQQFGFAPFFSQYTDQIKALGLEDGLNLYDGGTTGSKVFGEFGILGLLMIGLYLLKFIKYYKIYVFKQVSEFSSSYIFLLCCFLAVFIELFIRGSGYFTTNMFLMVCFIFASRSNEKFKVKI